MGCCACCAYITVPYKLKKCNVIIPGGGERVFAMTCDDELAFAIPQEGIQNIVEGVKGTHNTSVARIPTPFFGIVANPAIPSCYDELHRYVGIKE